METTIYTSKIIGKNLKAYVISMNESQVKYYLKFDEETMPDTKKSKLLIQFTGLFLNSFKLLN